MARKVVTTIVDDLDGTEGAGELLFAIDGTQYSIDLSDDNRTALAAAMQPYVEAARIVRNGNKRARATRRN